MLSNSTPNLEKLGSGSSRLRFYVLGCRNVEKKPFVQRIVLVFLQEEAFFMGKRPLLTLPSNRVELLPNLRKKMIF